MPARPLDQGLTNAELAERLFISPKTADHRVSAIIAKLDVRSRRHAADAARRLGVGALSAAASGSEPERRQVDVCSGLTSGRFV